MCIPKFSIKVNSSLRHRIKAWYIRKPRLFHIKRILEWITENKMELKNANSCDIMILVLQSRTNIFKK